MQRPPHAAASGRALRIRRSAATPISWKLMVGGAVLGPVVMAAVALGPAVATALGVGGPRTVGGAVQASMGVGYAVLVGVPTGALAGAFIGALRARPGR